MYRGEDWGVGEDKQADGSQSVSQSVSQSPTFIIGEKVASACCRVLQKLKS